MKQVLLKITLLAAGAVTASASSAEMASKVEEANQLVSLLKPHESETRAIHFMLRVAPMDMPAGLADCIVKEATPTMRSYFASQLAENLDSIELQQAIEFFQGPAGQTVVALRLEHEQRLLSAAERGEAIASEQPHYPASVQKELDVFAATPAGKFFVGDEFLARQAIRAHISDVRSEAMARCLTASN